MRRELAALAVGLGVGLAAACTVSPRGLCERDADCAAGLSCEAGVCVGCTGDASCRAWESCSANRCQLRAGRCVEDASCEPFERCDTNHACVPRPGRCDAGGGCEAWQTCQATSCVPQAGRCDTDGDCAAAEACGVDHACLPATLDPAAVALWGTLTDGTTCAAALAPLSSPSQGLVGFGCGRAGPALLDPLGRLVYADAPGGPIRRFHHDAMAWDPVLAVWAYPLAPEANDEVLVADRPCGGQPWAAWTLRADGAVRYACAGAGGWDWYDAGGAKVVSGHRVFGWTAGDRKLAAPATGGFPTGAAVVLDAAGASQPVVGLPAGTLLAARTSGEAFRLVLRVDAGPGATQDERWTVDAAGAATRDGVLPGAPADFVEAGPAVLDGAGWLHQPGQRGGVDVVLRRTLSPELALVAYTEAGAPAGSDDWWARPFDLWVRLDGGSRLVTGP